MAAAARSAPSFEVTAPPDIMDTHSDSGLDFNEDIDLELASPGYINDDVSVKDAETDTGFDIQIAPDHDDFMADNEDLDEDIITYDDAAPTDGQSTTPGQHKQQEASTADEDLIDYSDDEEEPAPTNEARTNPLDDGTADVGQAGSDSNEQLDPAAPSITYEESSYVPAQVTDLGQDVADDSRRTEQTKHEGSQIGQDDGRHATSVHEDEFPTNKEATPLATPGENEHAGAHEDTQTHAQSPKVPLDGTGDLETSNQARQEVQLHPVTINYESTEYWLFQHHDYENSGDFLIEDSTLKDKPISSVIEACRAALGEDVTDDIELGFRLDNFHNMELYQDHSSCAFITLEQFVSVYLQLHAQDGVTDPESFYMTLITRPRVSALLNTLNDAAARGIGHVGLNKDIASGLTLFNTHSAHESIVYEDWENGEQDGEHDSHGSNGADAIEEHDGGEREGFDVHTEEASGAPAEQQHEDDEHETISQPQVLSPTNAGLSEAANDHQGLADNQALQGAEDPASRTDGQPSPSNGEPTSEKFHEEDDLIDYSDDEGDADDSHGVQVRADGPSSASSTIQGDNASFAQETGSREYVEIEEAVQDYEEGEGQDQTQFDNDEEAFGDQTYEGEYYEDIHEANGQGDAEARTSPENFSSTHNDTTNYNVDFADHSEAQHVHPITDVDHGHHEADEENTGDDAFPGNDTFLDFEDADAFADAFTNGEFEDSTANDETNHDNEDGVSDQTPVAVSVAADPVVTSSSELLDLSPQGQKRTIDEVGNDGGDATDSSDAKRPRV